MHISQLRQCLKAVIYLERLNTILNFTEKWQTHSTGPWVAPSHWTLHNRFLNKRGEKRRIPSICHWKNNLCYKEFTWENRPLMGIWINHKKSVFDNWAWQAQDSVSDPAMFRAIILITCRSWLCCYVTGAHDRCSVELPLKCFLKCKIHIMCSTKDKKTLSSQRLNVPLDYLCTFLLESWEVLQQEMRE